MKKDYSELLKDPRWQKKRLEIFERDNWTCQICQYGDKTLNVHHRVYIQDRDPWDYQSDQLITLCAECHQEERETREGVENSLLRTIRQRFFSAEVDELWYAFYRMPMLHLPEVVMSAICWNLVENQQELIDKYFKSLKKKNNAISKS